MRITGLCPSKQDQGATLNGCAQTPRERQVSKAVMIFFIENRTQSISNRPGDKYRGLTAYENRGDFY
ncbi:hypothetical protein HNQ53_001282 [Microbulbifer hydrolyticus]|uniref:Uncharacterized protein n=1 Tax=Microbulbifer hydrolyticus TaxID=48074 RepID=A0AA89PBI9_9GAMM|nr:hypothetical protein [Microbulbifer hydrolyticus]